MPTDSASQNSAASQTAVPQAAAGTESLQEQVTRLKQELLEAQKLAALGELTSTTTHEFNNVLTTVLNYAKMGLRHTDEATRTKALEKILSAGQRAAKITNSVLGMARNRGHDPAPIDLSELVTETLVLLERELAKYRVSVETKFDTNKRALVVGTQIQQVLMNLLTNARQAMDSGGRILVQVSEDTANETINLTVRDTGSGIAPDVLPRIFERAFSTKQGPDATGKGGAGVGLSACREIIEQHGGRIRVESAVGKGTAFTLRLPIAREVSLHAAPTPQLGLPISAPMQSTV